MTEGVNPGFRAPAEPCPQCGGIFEAPFRVGDQFFGGHVPGGPACKPKATLKRDAKPRRKR